jgi:hypothetical protein
VTELGALVSSRLMAPRCGAKAAGLLLAEDLGLPVPSPMLTTTVATAARSGRLPVPRGVSDQWIVRPSFDLGISEADRVSGLIDSVVFDEGADREAVRLLLASIATASADAPTVLLLVHPFVPAVGGGGVAHMPSSWRGQATLGAVAWDRGGPSSVVAGLSSSQVHVTQVTPLALFGRRSDVEVLVESIGSARLASMFVGLMSLRDHLGMPIEVEWVAGTASDYTILQVQGLSNEVSDG